ncbi:UDP-N-acetylmuramoylalanine--D-glutamate ligase [Alkalispirillum mobile]|uniref:UDP-N-acetylmuramoylalanine--D-glutamate ligase n=1 Tax=Alkalispirillum mobile TaxID=85925 RepID=A0A498C175_9GAMM|nr:UDP-N-acetylmuramoyl-L-alanine--D-glutamate ligase [Alkalispirillum mobile]RLK46860.1 UDP-N-acetylmuramoylalanine--D-glutamate ligase [Alkalispirillum mobile]
MQTAERQTGYSVVVGLGLTGLACARFLARRGVSVQVIDSRAEPPEYAALQRECPDVPVHTGGFDAGLLRGAREVVVSPGVSLRTPALAEAADAGVPLISEIELFARHAAAPVVAITGSNGKSTVTTLVGLMAEAAGRNVAVGGNLGTPALALLDADTTPDAYILELSSFQLETTHSLAPQVATVLNISADHMDRHGSLAAYAEAKARVFHGDGVQVLNLDDPVVAAMARPGRPVLGFSLAQCPEQGAGVAEHDGTQWLVLNGEPVMPAAALRLPGQHNRANALAALCLGYGLGLPVAAMAEALRRFPGLPHRTEWVAEHAGVRWYNDSKGTNVGAAVAAVRGLDGPVVLIAGGEGKGADFQPLADALADKGRAAVLIGRDAPLLAGALEGALPVERAADMTDAVRRAARLAQAGDAVLLSPACASFDMFQGFAHRGEVFRAAVQEVAHG